MKEPIKKWTKMTFWAMIISYFIASWDIPYIGWIISICGISNFVLSILYLTKYKDKVMPIVGIILSTIFVLIPFIVGIVLGVM